MNNPGAANAAAAAGGGGQIPSFLDNPSACLRAIAGNVVSRELWGMLGGTAAAYIKGETQDPQVAALYLQAVAQQLPAADTAPSAAADANHHHNNNNMDPTSSMEAEMSRSQLYYEILDAVGHAVTKCNPRHTISQSGILRALLAHPSHKSSYLTQVQVEFCQACLMAEQYRFAARALEGTWPRPNANISVRNVLRYFLFRGMIHVGCNDWTMAVRCFWTCLTIPSEIVSALAVAAWKKLVLVQCLQMEEDDYRPVMTGNAGDANTSSSTGGMTTAAMSMMSSTSTSTSSTSQPGGPLSLPKSLPSCFSRFLSMASNKSQQKNPPEDSMQHHQPGVMVQEDFGEPSSQQPSQQQQQQQAPGGGGQQQQTPYVALGVKVYMDLAQAFKSGDRTKFRTLIQQHANLLQTDGNMGLVHQCETAMFHRHVYQLSRIYSVIPLTELATKLQVESPEQMKQVLQQLSMKSTPAAAMTSSSKVKHSKWPSIELEEDGMVVFNFASTTTYNEELRGLEDTAEEQELEDNIQELMQLTKQVQKLDVSIVTSPMYHALARRSNDTKMGPRGVEDL